MCAVKSLLLVCIVMSLIPAIGLAEQSQQSNKIYLSPFYRTSMSNGQNYSYTISISPPDKISSIVSAIVSFDIYINPTVTFNLWVNGKSCNNPSYTISTTYAGAGQSRITFDCSNVITKSGTYSIILQPTQANTGSINGWIDLTYVNDPKGSLEISGTEYSPGEAATVFLQLKDTQGIPINNGSCYLDIWYPANSSNVHPYQIRDSPMLKALGDDGVYYYDLVAPSILGVYMLSAKCSYSFDWVYFYESLDIVNYPLRQINSGTWQGSPIVLNSKEDGLYERCDGSIASPCSANYTFNLSVYGDILNISNISVYFSGESDIAGRILTMSYWNGTNFVNLANMLTYSGTGGSVPTGYDEYLTNTIPLNAIINNTVKLNLTTAGSVRVFQNWLTIVLLSAEGTIQDTKGSSELHITNTTATLIKSVNDTLLSANDTLWNEINSTNASLSNKLDSISSYLLNLNATIVNLNSMVMSSLSQISIDIGNIIGNFSVGGSLFLQNIAQEVWGYSNRTLTEFNATIVNGNFSINPALVWNYPNRTLSQFCESGDVGRCVWEFFWRAGSVR